jgi:glycine/D-amino acid oxidase-like deaminating enzyme
MGAFTRSADVDILIAGAGPAGATLAIQARKKWPYRKVAIITPHRSWNLTGADNQSTLQAAMLYALKAGDEQEAVRAYQDVNSGFNEWMAFLKPLARHEIFPFGLHSGAAVALNEEAAELIEDRAKLVDGRAEYRREMKKRLSSSHNRPYALFRTDDTPFARDTLFGFLRQSCLDHGVELIEGGIVTSISDDGRVEFIANGEAKPVRLDRYGALRMDAGEANVYELTAEAVVVAAGAGMAAIDGNWRGALRLKIYPTAKLVLSSEMRFFDDVSIFYEIGNCRSSCFVASNVEQGEFVTSVALTDATIIGLDAFSKRATRLSVARMFEALGEYGWDPKVVRPQCRMCAKFVIDMLSIEGRSVSSKQAFRTSTRVAAMAAGKLTTAWTTSRAALDLVEAILDRHWFEPLSSLSFDGVSTDRDVDGLYLGGLYEHSGPNLSARFPSDQIAILTRAINAVAERRR